MSAIGELRHRLTLQAADEIEDGAGGVTRTWESLGEVWAQIEPLSADDDVAAALPGLSSLDLDDLREAAIPILKGWALASPLGDIGYFAGAR